MEYLKIAKWAEYQSYRSDRGLPPWIKVHRNIFQKQKWSLLTDQQKGQLVSIWILAADKDGKIPADSLIVKKLALLDDAPDLQRFVDLGFIEAPRHQLDLVLTPPRRHDDVPEEEEEEDKRKNTHRSNASRFDQFWEVWPKKVKKKRTLEIWKRRKLDEIADTLIADVRVRLRTDDRWIRGFIPDPPTYLNGDRWEDEITKPKEGGVSLPYSDNQLEGFAKKHGLSSPRIGETFDQYRSRLLTEIQKQGEPK